MANNLLIQYDLMRPGQDYSRLQRAILGLGTATKILLSAYHVKSRYTAEQARDTLARVLDRNDKLVVVDATNETIAWVGLDATTAARLRQQWRNQNGLAARMYGA